MMAWRDNGRRMAALGLALMVMAPPAWAGGKPDLTFEAPGGGTLQVKVYERLRGEFFDWFDPGGTVDPSQEFFAHKFQLGLAGTWEHVDAFVQYQQAVLVGIPDDGIGPPGVYFANTARSDQVSNILRQGWGRVRFGLHDWRMAVKFGRFLYSDGAETVPSNATMAWVKAKRISQRMIGPFDYTHVGRSFDGAVISATHGPLNVTGFGFLPMSGGFEVDGGRAIDDIRLGGISVTHASLFDLPDLEGRLFWNIVSDNRPAGQGITVLDNRAAAVRAADTRDLEISTFGGHVLHARPLGPGTVDLMAWTGAQFGDWQSQDHMAWAYAFEAGYQLPDLWAKPWLRVGYWRSSGDDDPTDGDHQTFYQILPTARLYARTPFFNLMNNADLFAQLMLKPIAGLGMRIDYHQLRATEGRDIAYFGGGATKGDFFGFGGVPAAGDRELGHLLDASASYQVLSFVTASVYYGHTFGGSIIRNAAAGDDDIDYGYVELVIAF